jgi:hypothetical protein
MFTPQELKLPAPGVNNLWFLDRATQSVIVFVHGIFSDSRECWSDLDDKEPTKNRYWPALIESDPRFADASLYLGGYYTAVDSGPYEIRNCADELFRAMKRVDERGQTPVMNREGIFFICHSTGGIVTRYLLEYYAEEFRNKRVGLLLIASPSYGSKIADRLSLLSRFYNQRLGIQLQWGNWSLRDLDARFKDLVNNRAIPSLLGIEAYENRFILHRKLLPDRTVIVTEDSAGRYFGAPVLLRETDHFSCVKPADIRHPAHELLVDSWSKFGLLPRAAHTPRVINARSTARSVDDYQTLQQRLLLRGIRPSVDLAALGTQQLQARLIMEDIIVEGDLAGFAGVYPHQTRVTMTENLASLLPESVLQAKQRVREPFPNKPKVFLLDWEPPVIDTGANLKLKLCDSDYWTSLAMEEVRDELKREILGGKILLKSLPRRLNIAVVVITADLRLILCRRGGPHQTRYYADTWSLIGETMDAKEDRNQAGEIRPENTVLRALTEYDELNLPDEVAADAEIRFLAITTNWEYLLADMIALVRLRTKDFAFVRDCWTVGEHTNLGYIPFEIASCLQLITAGHYAPAAAPQMQAPINMWSRTGILAALFSEFSYHRVIAEI